MPNNNEEEKDPPIMVRFHLEDRTPRDNTKANQSFADGWPWAVESIKLFRHKSTWVKQKEAMAARNRFPFMIVDMRQNWGNVWEAETESFDDLLEVDAFDEFTDPEVLDAFERVYGLRYDDDKLGCHMHNSDPVYALFDELDSAMEQPDEFSDADE